MDNIDSIIKTVCKNMGVDRTKPPHWMPNVDIVRDQTTGQVVREYKRGYLCSYCGIHSWSRKQKCDGCNSVMQEVK